MRFFVPGSLFLALALSGCGLGGATSGPGNGVGIGVNSDTVDATDATDSKTGAEADAQSDSGVDVSCIGIAIVDQNKQFDSECAFLAKCPTSGQCYCGSKCADTKTPQCDPSICGDNDPKCFCGEQCSGDKKKCPKVICGPLNDLQGCETQDDCVFNNKKPPSECSCTAMPDREPDCWCGTCTPAKPACNATQCKGKNPDKCIVVVGAPHTQCYCKTCGLLGNEARCFQLECAGP